MNPYAWRNARIFPKLGEVSVTRILRRRTHRQQMASENFLPERVATTFASSIVAKMGTSPSSWDSTPVLYSLALPAVNTM